MLAGVSSLMFVAFTVYGVIKFYAVRFAYRVAFHDPQVWTTRQLPPPLTAHHSPPIQRPTDRQARPHVQKDEGRAEGRAHEGVHALEGAAGTREGPAGSEETLR